jgi:hypothetical protein
MSVCAAGLCFTGLGDQPVEKLVGTFGLILVLFIAWEAFDLWVRA